MTGAASPTHLELYLTFSEPLYLFIFLFIFRFKTYGNSGSAYSERSRSISILCVQLLPPLLPDSSGLGLYPYSIRPCTNKA